MSLAKRWLALGVCAAFWGPFVLFVVMGILAPNPAIFRENWEVLVGGVVFALLPYPLLKRVWGELRTAAALRAKTGQPLREILYEVDLASTSAAARVKSEVSDRPQGHLVDFSDRGFFDWYVRKQMVVLSFAGSCFILPDFRESMPVFLGISFMILLQIGLPHFLAWKASYRNDASYLTEFRKFAERASELGIGITVPTRSVSPQVMRGLLLGLCLFCVIASVALDVTSKRSVSVDSAFE